MIKMLFPMLFKMTFSIVNTDKPCKKDKVCEKAFTSWIIWVAHELVLELKKLVD